MKYGFHGTDAKSLCRICVEGLVPRIVRRKGEKRAVVEPVIFFAHSAGGAKAWGDVVLRFAFPKDAEEDPYGDAIYEWPGYTNWYTRVAIAPKAIEVLRDGKFVPLAQVCGRGAARAGSSSGRAMRSKRKAYPQKIGKGHEFAESFCHGGCLDWADAYADFLGGEYYVVELDDVYHHVVIKDGDLFRDAIGEGTAAELLKFWGDKHAANKRRLVPMSRKGLKRKTGFRTSESDYVAACSNIEEAAPFKQGKVT